MRKNDCCQRLIEGLVKQYINDKNFLFSIKNDIETSCNHIGLKKREVSKLIYPSIMFLADWQANKYGFKTSGLIYSIKQTANKLEFPLHAHAQKAPPNLVLILPFVYDVCEKTLGKDPILINTFERAIRCIDPDFNINMIHKMENSDSLMPKYD